MSHSQTTWKVAYIIYGKHSGPNTSKAPSHLCFKTKRETVAFIVNAHTHTNTQRDTHTETIWESKKYIYNMHYIPRSVVSIVFDSLAVAAQCIQDTNPKQSRTWHSNCAVRVNLIKFVILIRFDLFPRELLIMLSFYST